MNESTIHEIIEAAKDEVGEAGISKWNDGFIAGAEFGAIWYAEKLSEKTKISSTEENKQPFEQYPELAELILYAATNWKINYKWSETLGAINKVCAELTELRKASQHSYTEQKIDHHKDALELIANFTGDIDFQTACILLTGIAKNALNPNRKSELKQYAVKAKPQAIETITPPTYTQEQMIAFGEAILKEAADRATAYTYLYEHECRKDILNIDISKLLKTT